MKSSHKISNDRKHQRLTTSWTSACYNTWSTPLYHERAFGLHNNRISAQTVRNRLRFNATSLSKRILIGHVYTLVGYSDAVIQLFFRMNQDFLYNAMLTVVFLNEIVLGVGVLHGYRSPLIVIDGNLNVQRYRDDILAHHVIPLSITTPTSRFFSMIMPPLIQLETL